MWVPSFCHIANCLKTYKEKVFCSFYLQNKPKFRFKNSTYSEIFMKHSFYILTMPIFVETTYLLNIFGWGDNQAKNEFAYVSTPMTFSISTRSYYIPYVSQDFLQVLSKRFLPCMYLKSATSIAGLVLLVLLYQIEREIFFRSHKKS